MSETKPEEEEVVEVKQSDEGDDDIPSSSAPVDGNANDEPKPEVEAKPDSQPEIMPEPAKTEGNSLPPSTLSEELKLKGTALLKSLLSAASIAPPVPDKMITTTEVTDEKLNLKKILYQPDKEGKEDKTANGTALNTSSDTPNDDDDRRLIIDISDEEKDATSGPKSMPSLCTSAEDENSNMRKTTRPNTLETRSFATPRHYFRGAQQSKLKFSPSLRFFPS
jgi:hypothetical protein